jgi:hypothetical protein
LSISLNLVTNATIYSLARSTLQHVQGITMMVGILQNRSMGKQFVEKGNNNGLSSREHRYRKLHEKCTVLHDTFAKEYI